MVAWSEMGPQDVDLDALEDQIRSAGKPVHINSLARAAAQSWSSRLATRRQYAPGSRYARGEIVLIDGQAYVVKAVTPARNQEQGHFQIVALELPDGTKRLKAAQVRGAPAEPHQVSADGVCPESIDDGRHVRAVVGEALGEDPRFDRLEDSQGDQWCLVQMLPEVGAREISRALRALRGDLQEGELASKTTAELVWEVWRMPEDGSAEYALHAFALGLALSRRGGVQSLAGRWVRAKAWDTFTRRSELTVPRQGSHVHIPEGVTPAAEQTDEPPGPDVNDDIPQALSPGREDLEFWRSSRPASAAFVLHAHHYYEGWLPLSRKLGELFPPFSCACQEIVLHHHFGNEEESFRGWVDRHRGRIWMSQHVYETFRRCGIYPGARLRVTPRSEQEYDLATQPASSDEDIRVWRMRLVGGKIEYSDDLEPRRYDIDDHVFIADVRFEDLGALFRQAAEAGNSIFGLMYRKSVEWWEAAGRKDLHVSADRLYEALHMNPKGRMTTRGTIAWELWQRLAFKPLGGGIYLFRPEYGERRRLSLVLPQKRKLKGSEVGRRSKGGGTKVGPSSSQRRRGGTLRREEVSRAGAKDTARQPPPMGSRDVVEESRHPLEAQDGPTTETKEQSQPKAPVGAREPGAPREQATEQPPLPNALTVTCEWASENSTSDGGHVARAEQPSRNDPELTAREAVELGQVQHTDSEAASPGGGVGGPDGWQPRPPEPIAAKGRGRGGTKRGAAQQANQDTTVSAEGTLVGEQQPEEEGRVVLQAPEGCEGGQLVRPEEMADHGPADVDQSADTGSGDRCARVLLPKTAPKDGGWTKTHVLVQRLLKECLARLLSVLHRYGPHPRKPR